MTSLSPSLSLYYAAVRMHLGTCARTHAYAHTCGSVRARPPVHAPSARLSNRCLPRGDPGKRSLLSDLEINLKGRLSDFDILLTYLSLILW